jgi:hypothetical protein
MYQRTIRLDLGNGNNFQAKQPFFGFVFLSQQNEFYIRDDACHFSTFTNFESSIFSYQTLGNDTIFFSVRGPWSASVFLCIIIQCRSAVLKFVATHGLFISDEDGLTANTH